MDVLLTLTIWGSAAIISFAIAEQKGRNPWIAFAFGLLFAFLTVIYYWLTPGSKEYEIKKAQYRAKQLENKI